MADKMGWVRNRMQNHIAESAAREAGEKVVRLRNSSPSRAEHTQRALSLIADAADVISDIEERAAALQERGEILLTDAIEKLKAAEERITYLESDRKAAEARIREAELKVDEMQSAIDKADSRMRTAEARLSQAEGHARTFAARAEQAENALVQIEEAIRTQLIAKQAAPRKRAAVA